MEISVLAATQRQRFSNVRKLSLMKFSFIRFPESRLNHNVDFSLKILKLKCVIMDKNGRPQRKDSHIDSEIVLPVPSPWESLAQRSFNPSHL